MNYTFWKICSLPLIPLLIVEGIRIRKNVPRLPEAKNPNGVVESQPGGLPFNIIAIGESTFAGVGVETHQEGFTGTFAQEIGTKTGLNVSWQVYARSGYTVKKMTHKLIPKINQYKPDLIIIGAGGNNAFKLRSLKSWRKDIQEMINVLQDKFPNTPIAFTNMPPIKDFPAFSKPVKFVLGNLVNFFGAELKRVVLTFDNVFYSDKEIVLSDWIRKFHFKLGTSDFFSDGVHPSKLTYQTWAKDFAQFLISKHSHIFNRYMN